MKKLIRYLMMPFFVAGTVSCNKDTAAPQDDVKAVTVSEFLAAPESETQVYELVGTIGSTINTTFGNFDLTDATGTVYVFGLTAENLGYGTKNDKSFSSLGLSGGDRIRIRGYRGSYEDKIEVLYAWFIKKISSDGSGGDEPLGNKVSFKTNSDTQIWSAETDGTYGVGYSTTVKGLKIGFYKHTSGTTPAAPNANHVRIYKYNVLVVGPLSGKNIKKIVIGCAPDAGDTSYCHDMTGLEGGANATADKSALTVTWTGKAAKVVLHASSYQVRMEDITVEFE
jgi:hypothetical protein